MWGVLFTDEGKRSAELRAHLWGYPRPPPHPQCQPRSRALPHLPGFLSNGLTSSWKGWLQEADTFPPEAWTLSATLGTFSAGWHFLFVFWLLLDVAMGAGRCRWGHLALQRTEDLLLTLEQQGEKPTEVPRSWDDARRRQSSSPPHRRGAEAACRCPHQVERDAGHIRCHPKKLNALRREKMKCWPLLLWAGGEHRAEGKRSPRAWGVAEMAQVAPWTPDKGLGSELPRAQHSSLLPFPDSPLISPFSFVLPRQALSMGPLWILPGAIWFP